MTAKPLILEIKGNSLDDGPGIRSVIFFKGCPLTCSWCHNPESKSKKQEISFDQEECIACDTCLEKCSQSALSRTNPYYIDRSVCDLCFDCVADCPSGALEKVGKEIEVEEVVNQVLKDKPFYSSSNGGVTLSGGEPLLYMDYASAVLQSLKKEGIHTLVETCGLFPFSSFEEKILPYCDMVYIDLKIFDSDSHKKYCGIPNHRILENIKELQKLAMEKKATWLPRVPLVPGITDTEENLTQIAGFLNSNQIPEVKLMNYNPLWHAKARKIGVYDPLAEELENLSWLDKDKYEKCESVFREMGVTPL